MAKFILSIRWLFVLVIVLLVAGIIGSNYIFSYYLYEEQLTQNFLNFASIFQKEVELLTKPVESIIYNIQALVCDRTLNFNDIEKSNKFLMNFMYKYPYVTSINYGDGKGNGYLILNDRGTWLNRIKKAEEKEYVTWNHLDKEGKIIKKTITKDNYDPRQTVWYKQALNSQDIAWSEEYIFRTTKDPGITASLLLNIKTQEVIGIDMMIKDLSLILNKIKQTNLYPEARLYLISDRKNLIATTDEGIFKPGKIYYVNERDFPLLYEALKLKGIGKFTFQGQKWLVKISFLKIGNRNLSLIILIPYSFMTKNLNLNIFYQLLVSIFLLFLVLIYISKRYMNPLIDISKEIVNFGIKEIPLQKLSQRTDEIGLLSRAISDASSEILKSKRQLEESEKKCRTVSNLAPVGIYLVNSETERFEEANFKGLSMLGFTLEELKEKTLNEIFCLEKAIEPKNFKEKDSLETICKVIDKQGRNLEFSIKGIKIMLENKPYILISADDITEIKKLERKMLEAEQFELVRRSLGEAVHRFKDLINVIQGFATLAQSREANDFTKNALAQIINASKRAIYLTREILTVTGDRKYDIQNTDLNYLILSMKTKIETLVEKSINVIFEVSDKPLPVKLDIEAFDEIIINLLYNAKDAMIKRGMLTIKTEIASLLDKQFCVLSISDTGTGMDEETRKRIFEPFFTTKGASGTGLGLSIVYKIVKDHGGFIEVESEVGKGTTFKIYFPFADKS
jgi:PAS domain S-box-containing protein